METEGPYSIKFSFGKDAEGYATFRPDYPKQIYDVLRQRCGLRKNVAVLEIGPGTGLATKKLLDAGCRVTAVEPDIKLANVLSISTKQYVEQLELIRDRFETAVLTEQSFDLGIAAMSLHWLDAKAALRKAYNLLRPGGHWAMWWTVFGDPDNADDFARRTGPLFRELPLSPAPGYTPGKSYGLDRDQRVSDLQRAGFKSIAVETVDWECLLTTEEVIGLTNTFSPVAVLDSAKRSAFLGKIAEIVDHEFDGAAVRKFKTVLYTTQRPLD